jgi:hypothetical protein
MISSVAGLSLKRVHARLRRAIGENPGMLPGFAALNPGYRLQSHEVS